MKKFAIIFTLFFVFTLSGCGDSKSTNQANYPEELIHIDEASFVKTFSSLCGVKMTLKEKGDSKDNNTLYYYVNDPAPEFMELSILQNNDWSLIDRIHLTIDKAPFLPQYFYNVLLAIDDTIFDESKASKIYTELLLDLNEHKDIHFGNISTEGYRISIDDSDDELWFWIEKSQKEDKNDTYENNDITSEKSSISEESYDVQKCFDITHSNFMNEFSKSIDVNMQALISSQASEDTTYISYFGDFNNLKLDVRIMYNTDTKLITSLSINYDLPIPKEVFASAMKLLDNTITTDDIAFEIYNEALESEINMSFYNGHTTMISNSESGYMIDIIC